MCLLVPPIYAFIYIYLAFSLYDNRNNPAIVELLFHPLFTQIIFTVFWFWVGMRFTRFSQNSIKSYIIGNSIWLASFLLYLWHSFILTSETKIWFLFTLIEAYCMPFMWSGYELATLLESDVFEFNSTYTLICYIVMIFVFTIGFITAKVRVSSKIAV